MIELFLRKAPENLSLEDWAKGVNTVLYGIDTFRKLVLGSGDQKD